MHDRFRILTLKRPLPERSEAKEIFLVPTDAAQNPIIGPDLSEPSAYLPSREALQAHPSPNVCKNGFSPKLPAVYLLHQQFISLLIITSKRHVIGIHGPFFYAAVRQSFGHFQIACFSLVMKVKMFLSFFAVASITNREGVVDGRRDNLVPILSQKFRMSVSEV